MGDGMSKRIPSRNGRLFNRGGAAGRSPGDENAARGTSFWALLAGRSPRMAAPSKGPVGKRPPGGKGPRKGSGPPSSDRKSK